MTLVHEINGSLELGLDKTLYGHLSRLVLKSHTNKLRAVGAPEERS